jgi:hypothetical protein
MTLRVAPSLLSKWLDNQSPMGSGSELGCWNFGVQCRRFRRFLMKSHANGKLKDGSKCKVVEGTHAGKSGIVRDVKTSKTGHVTITVVQATGERFKTLVRNVVTKD